MLEVKKCKKISNDVLEALNKKEFYINSENLNYIDANFIKMQWTNFFFEIMNELELLHNNAMIEIITINALNEKSLYSFFKNNWKNLIEDYNLTIDMDAYAYLLEYKSLQEWTADAKNYLVKTGDTTYYLIQVN